jgi:hypothetical protein
MAVEPERTKYELSGFDNFPIATDTHARSAAVNARMPVSSHCPLPEPMFNVATFLRRKLHGS